MARQRVRETGYRRETLCNNRRPCLIAGSTVCRRSTASSRAPGQSPNLECRGQRVTGYQNTAHRDLQDFLQRGQRLCATKARTYMRLGAARCGSLQLVAPQMVASRTTHPIPRHLYRPSHPDRRAPRRTHPRRRHPQRPRPWPPKHPGSAPAPASRKANRIRNPSGSTVRVRQTAWLYEPDPGPSPTTARSRKRHLDRVGATAGKPPADYPLP